MSNRRKLLESTYEEAVGATLSPEEFSSRVLDKFQEYGYFVGFLNRCWCEGKADGYEHTPGCAGIAQDKLHEEL